MALLTPAILEFPCEMFLQGGAIFGKVCYRVTMVPEGPVYDFEELIFVVPLLFTANFVHRSNKISLALAVLLRGRGTFIILCFGPLLVLVIAGVDSAISIGVFVDEVDHLLSACDGLSLDFSNEAPIFDPFMKALTTLYVLGGQCGACSSSG